MKEFVRFRIWLKFATSFVMGIALVILVLALLFIGVPKPKNRKSASGSETEEKRPWDFVFEEAEDLGENNEASCTFSQDDKERMEVQMKETKTAEQSSKAPSQDIETPSRATEISQELGRGFSLREAVVHSVILERPYK